MKLPDLVSLVGLLLLASGLWLVGAWLSLAVVGALLLVWGVLWSRANARSKPLEDV